MSFSFFLSRKSPIIFKVAAIQLFQCSKLMQSCVISNECPCYNRVKSLVKLNLLMARPLTPYEIESQLMVSKLAIVKTHKNNHCLNLFKSTQVKCCAEPGHRVLTINGTKHCFCCLKISIECHSKA